MPWTFFPRDATNPDVVLDDPLTNVEWVWRRATVHGAHYSKDKNPDDPTAKTVPVEGVSKQQYLAESHKQAIDRWHPHAVGSVYDMMHQSSAAAPARRIRKRTSFCTAKPSRATRAPSSWPPCCCGSPTPTGGNATPAETP